MDRVAVFIDAGYLFAQGSVLLSGKKLPRAEITLIHEAMVNAFEAFAIGVSRVPLLRIYWYDGTSTGPTAQHLTLAHLHDVKVRLGFVNSVGEQKGVDSLIVTDMITLARNRAISDAVLVSGDEDLRVGVQQAQEFGVRVHLVGIRPSRGSQSLFLLQEADTTHEWGPETLETILRCHPSQPSVVTPQASGPVVEPAGAEDRLRGVASRVAEGLEQSEIEALIDLSERQGQIPRDVDGRLLGGARAEIGRDLDPPEKKTIRAQFIAECRRRLPG